MTSLTYQSETPHRLDLYLHEQGLGMSRSQITRWIKGGCVLVNGRIAKPARRLEKGDAIMVNPPTEIVPSVLSPEDISLDILYEDRDLLIVNKSTHMVVHPGAGHGSGTLTHALLAHCGQLSSIGGVMRPGIVHRLDKGTSGVMVVAKNDRTHIGLSDQFKRHEVKKIYRALVYGEVNPLQGTIDTLLSRHGVDRKKYRVSQFGGRRAVTHYRVLQIAEGLSDLEIRLETGRTHQIRVHLTHRGYSIVGDPLYGAHSKRVKTLPTGLKQVVQKISHTLLHAQCLQFAHPITGREMTFVAPLPEDYDEVIQLCFSKPKV